jgi:hypothetical protein
MRYLIAAYLTAVAIVIIAKMITQAKSGRVELFSIRATCSSLDSRSSS